MPIEYRALVGGVASLGWNTWLSYLNSRQGLVVEEEAAVVGAPAVVAEVVEEKVPVLRVGAKTLA